MKKALFIILDNTLITTRSGKSFPLHSEDWKFKIGWYEIIKNLSDDFIICIVDNQIGVGEGYVNEQVFNTKIENICKILEKELHLKKNSIVSNFCFKQEEEYRVKPNPGLIYELALDYEIRLDNSIMIGGSADDEYFAAISGIKVYYDVNTINESLFEK